MNTDWVSRCLAGALLFSLAGCDRDKQGASTSPKLEGLVLVKSGSPQGVIVCSSTASPLVKAAVAQFVHTVKRSTGATLPVISTEEEATLPKKKTRIFVGDSPQAKAAGLIASELALETYAIKSDGKALYIVGADEPADTQGRSELVSRPTLWALNRLLEENLGVRWLWPGELGTFVPARNDFSLPLTEVKYQPSLVLRSLRLNLSSRRHLASSDPTLDAKLKEEALLWTENHQAGRRGNIRMGHAFSDWWERFAQTNPDYFAELPEGIQAPFPRAERAKLRLSNPDVIEQIARDYIAAGSPKYWNVCPNDGGGFDISEGTRAWDLPLGQPPEKIFNASANLTARFVEFWNRVYARLVTINPEVTLATYAYSAYRAAPPAERPLTARAAIGIVDTYNAYDAWKGWAATGSSLVLRPNWWHQGGDAPYLPLQKTARYLKFASENGMIGIDMDSVIGYWAAQGINYYLTARLMTRPELSLDEILSEYASAFGGGAPKIREYLDYWQKLSDEYNYPLNAAFESPEASRGGYQTLVKAGKISANILNGSKYALPYLYSDDVVAPAKKLLQQAKEAINPADKEALQRVEFLQLGLRSLEATREQIVLGEKLRKGPTAETKAKFTKGSDALDALREELTREHAIWGTATTTHEDRYKVLIRPANVDHHKINLDGL